MGRRSAHATRDLIRFALGTFRRRLRIANERFKLRAATLAFKFVNRHFESFLLLNLTYKSAKFCRIFRPTAWLFSG